MYESQPFIRDNLDKMYVGKSGDFHTILVVGDESPDGVLVESEGYDYARYVSFLPEAKEFLKRKMEELADKIITDRRKENPEELVRISFSELSEKYFRCLGGEKRSGMYMWSKRGFFVLSFH